MTEFSPLAKLQNTVVPPVVAESTLAPTTTLDLPVGADAPTPTKTTPAWLTDIIEGGNKEGSDTQQGLPDLETASTEFMPSTTGLPDTNQVTEPNELDEVKKLLADIKDKQVTEDDNSKFEETLKVKMEELTAKFGKADPKLVEEFGDLLGAFRSQVGGELSEMAARDNLELRRELETLKSQISAMSTNPKTSKTAPSTQDTNVYRNTVAQAVPEYNNIINSDYFKKLLATPVDANNSAYTYNHKLGDMFKNQQTQNIISFFTDVNSKLNNGAISGNVVVDNGGITTTSKNNLQLTPEKLHDIYKKILDGELVMSESDLNKLRQAAAKNVNQS